MTPPKRIYGIDLGTTYSCISYVDEYGKPVVLANSEGQLTTPSVVYFEHSSNIVVGKAAKDVAWVYADRVVSTVKRVMGDPHWVYEFDGKKYHAQDISSFILRKLVADAQVSTGETITDVVITCPAYFGVNEKEATRQAGILAGLTVHYVIPEPTAAAISYGIDLKDDQVILVYDLGGGTFDITLIEVTQNGIKVICTGGDHQLGGTNWDEAIATWYADQFSNDKGVPVQRLTEDRETWQELLSLSEADKISLSTRTTVTRPIQFDGQRSAVELRRDKFNELTAHLFERTVSMTEELLDTARTKGYPKVDKLLLVGGSTYMPQVLEGMKSRFPMQMHQFDPNQAVAKGAALFGYKCYLDDAIKRWLDEHTKGGSVTVDEKMRERAEQAVAQAHGMALPGLRKFTEKTIQNVASKSFGIFIVDTTINEERVNNLIVVNDSVPRSISRRYFTLEEDQETVMLRCMENTENVGPEKTLSPATSTEVGSAELRFTKALPKNSPVEVTFSLREDGLLSLHGKDLTTNQEIHAQFKTDSVFTREELEKKKSRNLAMSVT